MTANFSAATATVGNTSPVTTNVTSTYYTLSNRYGMIGGTATTAVGAGSGTTNNTYFSAYTTGTGYQIGTNGTSSTTGQAAGTTSATTATSNTGYIDFIFTNRYASETYSITGITGSVNLSATGSTDYYAVSYGVSTSSTTAPTFTSVQSATNFSGTGSQTLNFSNTSLSTNYSGTGNYLWIRVYIYNASATANTTSVFSVTGLNVIGSATNPTAQSLPYGTLALGTQATNVGWTTDDGLNISSPSNAASSGWAFWCQGASNSQANAITTAPTADWTATAVVGANSTTAPMGTAGGCYGYSAYAASTPYSDYLGVTGNTNTAKGDCQPVLALNTTSASNVTLGFDLSLLASTGGINTSGVDVEGRVGTSGSWTSLGTIYSPTTATVTYNYPNQAITLPASFNNQSVVQIRWANWTATSSQWSWTLNNVFANTSPTAAITSSLAPSNSLGVAGSYSITTSLSSPTTYTATYNGSTTLPTGFSLSGSTISVSTSATAGTYNIIVGATNAAGGATYATIAYSIVALPVITSSLSVTATTGTAISTYTLTASNTPTSYTATSLPTGLSFNSGNQQITGTPSVSGIISSSVSATNGFGTTNGTLVFSISSSSGPSITSSLTYGGIVGSALSTYTIVASGATGFNAANLPAGLSINTSTGAITGTPTTAGTYNTYISATNAGGNSTVSTLVFTIISAPTITSISPSSVLAGGSSFTLTVNGTNFGSGTATVYWGGSSRTTTYVSSTQLTATILSTDIASVGTAAVGVTVAYSGSSASSSTTNCSIVSSVVSTNTTAGTGTWTCPAGVTLITVQAWGGGGAGGGSTSTSYNEGGGGAGGSYVYTTLSVSAGTTYNFTVGAGGTAASGAAGGAGGTSYFGNTTAGSPTGATVSANGGGGGTAGVGAGSSGTRLGGFAGGTCSITGNLPSSPLLDIAGTSGAASVSGGTGVGTSGAGGAGANSGGAGGAGLVYVSGSTAGTAGTAPGGGGGGSSSLTTTEPGGAGGAGEVIITYSVAPIITSSLSNISDTVSKAAATYTITAVVQGSTVSSYAASGLPSGLSVNTSTGAITGTPTATGTFSVTISATSANGFTGSATISITVVAAPSITSVLTATGATGIAISTYTITATYSPTSFSDTTSLGVHTLPAGLSLNTSTGAITGTPTAAGTYNVTISATNAIGTGSATLVFTIGTGASSTWTFATNGAPTNVGNIVGNIFTASGPTTPMTGGLYSTIASTPDSGLSVSPAANYGNWPADEPTGTTAVDVTNYLGVTTGAGYTAEPRYVEFYVTPTTGNNLTVTNISIPLTVNGASTVTHYAAVYSLNDFSSGTFISGTTSTGTTLSQNVTTTATNTSSIPVPDGDTLRVRVFLWRNTTTANIYETVSFGPDGSYGANCVISGSTTAVTVPTGAPTGPITYTSVTGISFTANWTALGAGSSNSLVVVYPHGATPVAPSTGTAYTANSVYGSGSTLGTGYVVYNGTGLAAPISGLTSNTQYDIYIYSLNGTSTYYTTSSLSGNETTLATPTITSSTTATAYAGVAFSYQTTASSSYTITGYSSSTSFTGALSGVSIDASTGLLSGTITTTGTYSINITVTNTQGSTSITLTLTVGNVTTPTLTSLSSTSSLVGSSGFTITVNGTNFIHGDGTSTGSIVTWAGSNRTTTYVSSTQLTATINTSDLTTVGTYAVGVSNIGTTTASSSTISYSVSNSVVTPITSTGNGTWTCPAGVHAITVETWGAGGYGGGVSEGASNQYTNAGGGAGGSYVKANVAVSPGTVYKLTVGAAGAAVYGTGSTGGSSFFGNSTAGVGTDAVVLATGGAGGTAGTGIGTTSAETGGFAGGTGSTTGNIVPSSGLTIAGTSGGTSVAGAQGTAHSGAGGAAPTGSITGGTGGAAVLSTSAGSQPGAAGVQPGGGGSGESDETLSEYGGAGGAGEIIISYTIVPSITSSFTASGVENSSSPFSYTITASNSPTSYSESGALPAGLTFASGVISGTPSLGSSGTYSVTISATNSYGTGSATLVITITNQTPVITSSLTTINGLIGTAISTYTITATNTPTSYSASGLPTGLSVDGSTGAITGTPTAAGTFTATISATNSVTTGSASLTFVIASSISTAITATGTGTWTCPAGIHAITVETWGAGGYGGGITENASNQYTNAGGGAGGSYVKANIAVTPGTTYNLTVGAAGAAVYGTGSTGGSSYFGNTSSGLSSGAVILATGGAGGTAGTGLGTTAAETGGFAGGVGSTTGNVVPSNGITIAGASGGTSLAGAQGTAHSGAGGAAPTGSISGGTGGAAVLSTSAGSQPGKAGNQPGGGGSGESDVTLSEYGGAGGAGEVIITYSALPIITSAGTASGTVGTPFTYSIVASGSPTGYTVTGSLPNGISYDPNSGVISGTPLVGAGGADTVTISATNAYGTGSSTFIVTIAETPSISSGLTLTVSENTPMPTYTITALYSPTSYGLSGTLPAGLSFTAGTGTITGTPTATGTYPVTISATNATGTGSATLTITVDARPGITSNLIESDTIGKYFAYNITASQAPTSYNATGLPTGLQEYNGVIFGTPTVYGTFNVTLSATNNVGTGNATLVLTIDSATNYYYVGSGALDNYTNWYTSTNLSVAVQAPSTVFTQTGVTFNILKNATTASNGSSTLTIGTTSRFLVGSSSVNNVTLTIDATHALASTDSVDIIGTNTVSIANTTLPLLHTLATTSTVVYAQNATQAVSITPTYGNLTISGTTVGTLVSGTITINGTLTINSGATLIGTTSGSSVITVNGAAVVYGTLNLPTASTAYVTGTGTFSMMSGSTLYNGYNGGIASTTVAIRTTGTRYFDPGASYVIQPDATGVLGTGFPSTCANLTIAPSATGKTITLSQALNVTGTLSITEASTVLATGGYLTLKSTSITNSAIVGTICSTCSITGTATVERYIPAGYRGYRDLAPQVYGAGSIYNNWQEGGSLTHNGYGIFITGPTSTDATLADYASGQKAANGTTGLDYSLNGISSAFTYNNANGSWYSQYAAGYIDSIANTKTTNLDPFTGYRVLVRGDRSFNLATTPILNYPAGLRMYNPTTVRATGNLVYGTVTYSTTGVTGTANGSAITSTNALNANATVISNSKIIQGLSMVANPYDCPVSWTSVYNNSVSAGSNINGTWYFLDPTYGATGTYEGYNYAAGSQFSDETNASDLIQAGQAFFVLNAETSPTPKVVFEESAKQATSTKLSIFGASAPLSKIYVELYNGTTRTDGAAVAFRNDFTNDKVGSQDAYKLGAGNDNISVSDKGVELGIDGRLPATASDAIALKIGSPTATSYQLKVDASRYIDNGVTPLLYDAYKNTTTALGSAVTTVNFTVDANTAASYANRFTIIFTPSALAVNSIVASATLSNKVATITWNTVGEKGESYYSVEKSTDGKNFTAIGQQAAKNTATASYTATDNSVVEGNNYYRIKAVSETGSIAYSNVAKVQLTVNSNQFTVYPNPLVGKTLNVSLGNVAAGKYVVSIYNVLGEKVNEQTISHSGGSATHAITINNTLAGGVYSLVIREASSNQIVHQSNLSVQP